MPSTLHNSGALSAAEIAATVRTDGCEGVTIFAVAGPGARASGKFTLTTGLAVTEAPAIASHAFTAKKEFAQNTVTCAGVQAGDTVVIGGVTLTAVADNATPGAAEFKIGSGGGATQNNECAANLAYASLAAAPESGAVGVAASAVVTFTAQTRGEAGNDITLTTGNGTRLAVGVAGGKLTGAFDTAADEFAVMSTLALSAAELADAINRSSTSGIDGVVTAQAVGAEVHITAVDVGSDGNSITLTAATHATRSGATLTGGGTDARTLTVELLADDESTVLYSQTVSIAAGAKVPVTISPEATSISPAVGIPVVPSRHLKLTLPVGTTATEARLVAVAA